MADRRSQEDQLASVSIFAEMSKRELKALRRLMTPVQVTEGRELTRQDEPGREFMVILEGTAVVKRNGRKVADLGPGDFLGELAVLSGAPRTATVVATSEMSLEVLNRRELMTMLDENPRVARKILVGAVKRLHDLETSKTA